ncbi:MAG: hypothetical protein KAT56_02905, partial [Sedimentisphaerales bacterium]|nr:hypothetical protein [Sedimentisphaerales bacterium]
LTVAGNIAGITVGGDLAGEINATGSMGRISSVSVGGELSASLSAYNSIMTINAGGDITSDAITIEGSGNGLLCRLSAGGNVNVADLSVDGSLLFLTAGSSQSPGNLSGSISADNMIMMMNVYGNVSGDVTAGSQLYFATINGDLSADADITSTNGDIIKLLVGNKIYGNVHARNGEGRVIIIQRGQNAFVNADTGIADTAAVHINADLARTLWLNV